MNSESNFNHHSHEPAVDEQQLLRYVPTGEQAKLFEVVTDQLAAGKEASKIDGYLGYGSDKSAFRLDAPTGSVVVKVVHEAFAQDEPTPRIETIKQAVMNSAIPLIVGRGVPGLEQLIAVDMEKGLLMTTYAQGKRVSGMSSGELLQINEGHLITLKGILDTMRSLGLHPHNIGGVFFDRKAGFNLVDYALDRDDIAGNNLDASTLENFVKSSLMDYDKINALLGLRELGLSVPADAFKTTGMRALLRAYIARKARLLS